MGLRQIWRVWGLCFLLVAAPWGHAEDIPAPPQPGVRHYIELPPGGLTTFLRWYPTRVPLVSHHRGGPVPGSAENSLEAMQNALLYGPGLMEVDVAQLGDGTLILMHDDTIDRTTTGAGRIEDLAWDEVAPLYLRDEQGKATSQRVPKLWDALRWAQGRSILTLDIKKGTDFFAVAKIVEESQAQDYVIAISYTLEQAEQFHEVAPWMPLSVTIRNDEELRAVLASSLDKSKLLVWTGTRLLSEQHYQSIHAHGWKVIVGTLGNPAYSMDSQFARAGNDKRYLDIYNLGADIIATDRFWAVQQQIRNPNIFVFSQSKTYR